MISRRITPRRQGRGLITTIALTGLVSGTLLAVGAALAMNQTGAFELDGNAVSANASAPYGPADDWDRVCHQVTAGGTDSAGHNTGALCTSATNTNNATAVAWTDATGHDAVFQGGGSKDFYDPENSWLWASKSSPDKDTLVHSYAARYSLTPDANTCPVPAGQTSCEVIFFGADRYSNDGDAQMGFWFFQNAVGPSTVPGNGGNKFSGHHMNGDLLVISDFSNGGTTANIKAYKWDTSCLKAKSGSEANYNPGDCAAANVRLIAKATGANCGQTTSTAPVCGIVNAGTTTINSPWPFTDKGGNVNKFAQGEFYEAGINLSNFNLGGECFSSMIAETRSSDSISAVLKDFIGSGFGECTTTIETTAQGPTGDGSIGGGSVSSGTDKATLDVKGAATWGGKIDFYLCGPIADTAVCDGHGVLVSTSNNISNADTQPFESGSATLTSAGRYCWFSKFTPDAATAAKGVPVATDDGSLGDTNKECFTVSKVTPSLTTCSGTFDTATPPVCTAASAVNFGSSVSDRALLSGAAKEPGSNGAGGDTGLYKSIGANNGAYAGTIAFTLKGPANSGCGVTATGTGTNPQSVNVDTSVGNKIYGPVSFTPDSPGKFHWQATYTNTGSANNTSPVTDNASCDQAREDVTVNQITTTISTRQFVYPQDRVVIDCSPSSICSTGTGNTGNLAGSVTFALYDTSANCQTGGATGRLYQSASPISISGAAPQTASTNGQTTYAVTAGTTVYWRVTYSSTNSAQLGNSSVCTEQTTVSYAGNDTNITVP